MQLNCRLDTLFKFYWHWMNRINYKWGKCGIDVNVDLPMILESSFYQLMFYEGTKNIKNISVEKSDKNQMNFLPKN